MDLILVATAVSIVVELGPGAAAVAARRRLTRPLVLVAMCFTLMFIQDVVRWSLAERGINNHWVSHAGRPAQTLLLLFALADWQTGETSARAVRFAAFGFLVLWVLLTGLEDPRTFSRFVQPLQAILVLAVAAWTMVRRTADTYEAPPAEPWFWVCAGLLLYFGSGAVLGPISHLLLGSSPDLVTLAYEVKSVVNIVAYLLVTRGILCSLPSGSSGGSWSPPASSPSSSRVPSSSR